MNGNFLDQQLSGLKAHIWQRISAVYLLLYTPYFAWTMLSLPTPLSSATDNPLLAPLFLLSSVIAIALVLVHAWVGGRDILIDYLPRERLKLWLGLYFSLLLLVAADLLWLLTGYLG